MYDRYCFHVNLGFADKYVKIYKEVKEENNRKKKYDAVQKKAEWKLR